MDDYPNTIRHIGECPLCNRDLRLAAEGCISVLHFGYYSVYPIKEFTEGDKDKIDVS